MKKLLSLLATIGITSSTTITVVACGDPTNTDNNGENGGDETETPGGDEGEGVNNPKNIINSLQKRVNEIINSHLFAHSSIFEFEQSESAAQRRFFKKETFESFYTAEDDNLSTSTDWKSVQIENEQKNNLLLDLETLIEKGQLADDLNELKNDQYYGYSYYLSGVDSVLKSITLNEDSNNFQIKRISTTDSDGNISFTYQVKVKFNVNWQYIVSGNLQDEAALNYEYMYSSTSDKKISDDMQTFLTSYKKEILKLENSFVFYDNKVLGLDSDGIESSNKYSAFSSVTKNIAENLNKSNSNVLTQLNQVLNNSLGNNADSNYQIKGVNDDGTGLETLSKDSLSVSFDFFNNQTSPLTNIRPAANNQYLYHYLQTKVLGANDAMPSWETSGPENLKKIAIGQFLYDKGQVGNTLYTGLNYLKMNDEKLKSMLIESQVMAEDSETELSNNVIKTADNAWSFGYINLANLKFDFGDGDLTLPVLNIPYTYSIKVNDKDFVSKSSSRLTENEANDVKTNVIDMFSKVLDEWTNNLHKIYNMVDAKSLNSLVAFEKNSAFSKALDPLKVSNKNIPTNQITEALTAGNNNSFSDKYNVPFEFFIDLGKGFVYSEADNGFKIGKDGSSTRAHIQIKFGFFNFYLFNGSGSTIGEVYNGKSWAIKFA